jgi:hypothetical protein
MIGENAPEPGVDHQTRPFFGGNRLLCRLKSQASVALVQFANHRGALLKQARLMQL